MKRKKISGPFWTTSVLLFFMLSLVRVYGADKTYWAIQVASYKTEESAKRDLERLKVRPFPHPRIEKVPESWYPFKLVIGRFAAQEDGNRTLEWVKSLFPAAFKRSFTPPSPPPLSVSAARRQVAPPSAIALPSVEAVAEIPEEAGIPEALPAEISSTIVSFEDLGYSKETSLSGSSPEFVFHLLHYKGLKRADAEIALRLSNVLSEKSTLTVKIDDVLQFTKNLKETGSSPRLSFPIPLAQNRHVKVAVAGHLFVSEDRCEDRSSGNLWMVVSGKSRLILSGDNPMPDTISDFFRDYKKEINVVLDPEKVSLEALPLLYYLHPINDWKKINVRLNQKPSGQQKTIRVGYGEALAGHGMERMAFL